MILPAQSSVEDQTKMFVLVHIFNSFIIKVQLWGGGGGGGGGVIFLFVNTIDLVLSGLKFTSHWFCPLPVHYLNYRLGL